MDHQALTRELGTNLYALTFLREECAGEPGTDVLPRSEHMRRGQK